MRIIRAGEHIQHIPGYGISVRESGVAVAAAAGWWEVAGATCIGAWQAKAAASKAASLQDLSGSGSHLSEVGGAITWDAATGWYTEGSAQKLRTPNILTGLDVTNHTCYVRVASLAAAGWNAPCGASNAPYADGWRYYFINVRPDSMTGVQLYKYYQSNVSGGAWQTGVLCVSERDVYYNGAYQGQIAAPPSPCNFYNAWELCGAWGRAMTGYVLAGAYYTDKHNSTQVALVSTAMAAL